MPSDSLNTTIWVLACLVALALIVNVAVIVYGLRIRGQILTLRRTVRTMLQEAVVDLQRFEALSMHFAVRIQEEVPIQTNVPVREQLEINVQGHVPFRQTVTSDVAVNAGPLGFKVPMNVSVPLDLDVPIDLQVPVLLDTVIPVSMNVPIDLTIPVEVDLAKTELGEFIEQVRVSLIALEDLLGETEVGR